MGEGSGVAMSCGVGCRHGLDPVWLWLWCRLAAVAPIQPLACEPPYATGGVPPKQFFKKKNTEGSQYLIQRHPGSTRQCSVDGYKVRQGSGPAQVQKQVHTDVVSWFSTGVKIIQRRKDRLSTVTAETTGGKWVWEFPSWLSG